MDLKLAVILVLTILPLVLSSTISSESNLAYRGEEGKMNGGGLWQKQQAWPCCDRCGACTRSIPPQCQCLDLHKSSCHPSCKLCLQSPLSVDPPMFQCMDRIPNYCQLRCSNDGAGGGN